MRRARRLLFVGGLLLLLVTALSAQERADRVILRDGTVVEGLLLEQSPGDYLLVEGTGGSLHYLAGADIITIEHDSGAELSTRHEDIVMLHSGVILRGTIRDEAPGRYIRVEFPDGGPLVTIPFHAIWKTLRRPLPPADDPQAAAAAREEAVTLRLEITLGRRRTPGLTPGTGETGTLEGLAQELAGVEQSRRDLDVEQSEARREADEVAVTSTVATLDGAIEELSRLALICEEGPVRSKGNGSDEQQTDGGLFGPRVVGAEPTAYREWSLQDIAGQLRANTGSLADQAASPAGDPASLASLQDRYETRAEVARLISPRAGTRLLQLRRIGRAAADLPAADRELLYATNRRTDQLQGIALNAIPFLNLGSLIQGDFVGAASNAVLMAAGAATVVGSFLLAETLEPVQTDVGMLLMPAPQTTLWVGTAVLAAAYVSSLARPIWYQVKCNRLLADALEVHP